MNQRNHLSDGLTLVELLVVLGVIGLLASTILPHLSSAREKARVAAAQVELDALVASMSQLYDDTGVFPNNANSYCRTLLPLDNEISLASSSAGLLENGLSWGGWNGPYIESVEDPWGSPYYLDEDYQCLASTTGCKGITDFGNDSSVIVSCGPNGATDLGSCAYDADNVVYRLCGT